MEPTELQNTAKTYGWYMIKTKQAKLISFGHDGIRINIYYTTGTVGICIPKKQQRFIYKQTSTEIRKLFETIPEGVLTKKK